MKFFKLKIVGIILLALVGVVFALPHKAQAASWDPGRIIDDGKFTNNSSMSDVDIQNFLNSKVPTCDTWHAPGSGAQGSQPPWTCLKDYSENGRSAAHIIWEHAQNYHINPQVLIVTLQKENGLITDTWPYPWQYRTAMGFACPDNGSCDPTYYGFDNQVGQAAKHFRNFYNQNPNWYIPFHVGDNYIQWSPNGSCGGSNVNIVTHGTVALYSYTPYQPNSAAINNLYGTGDGCSAYGNRNFWRDYNNWFGSTLDSPYQWDIVSQTYSNGNTNIIAGERETITLTARNTGTATWSNTGPNPVRLGTWSPGRQSSFRGTSWSGGDRAATLQESSVAPGQTGTFVFNVQAPSQPGSYQERFNLVAENAAWMNDNGMYYVFNVSQGNLSGQVNTSNFPGAMNSGASQAVTLKIKNTGNVSWYNDGSFPIDLGTFNPIDHTSPFYNSGWLNKVRPARLVESGGVPPGQVGTFNFNLTGPSPAGSYSDAYSLVAENFAWFNQPISFTSQVGLTYQWQQVSQNFSSGSTTMDPGDQQTVTVVVKNTGTATWSQSGGAPVRLGTWLPDRTSATQAAGWVSSKRLANLQESSVAPGQNGTFIFDVRMPDIGDYTERYNLVAEGIQWFSDMGANYHVTARSNYAWQVVSQQYSNGSVNIPRGSDVTLTLKAKNVGDTTWHKNSGFPIRLGTSRPFSRGSILYSAGNWLGDTRAASLQEDTIAPGQTGTFVFKINTSAAPVGARAEYFDLVAEGLRWFPDLGMYYYINFQ